MQKKMWSLLLDSFLLYFINKWFTITYMILYPDLPKKNCIIKIKSLIVLSMPISVFLLLHSLFNQLILCIG